MADNEKLKSLMKTAETLNKGMSAANDRLNSLSNDFSNDVEEDVQYAREKIKSLIDKAEQALEIMMMLAEQSEHPRAFEVLILMLKETSNMSKQLVEVQKDRKDLHGDSMAAQNQTTNNNLFFGSTTELQKFLHKDSKPIDV